MSSSVPQNTNSNPEYVEKRLFDFVIHKLLVKIADQDLKIEALTRETHSLRRDNGSIDGLYRKMNELLMQMRSSYHFANEYDYEEESE